MLCIRTEKNDPPACSFSCRRLQDGPSTPDFVVLAPDQRGRSTDKTLKIDVTIDGIGCITCSGRKAPTLGVAERAAVESVECEASCAEPRWMKIIYGYNFKVWISVSSREETTQGRLYQNKSLIGTLVL